MFNKDTIIDEILNAAMNDEKKLQGCANVLFSIGMHCLGCPSSRYETIEQACAVHGIADVDGIVKQLNDVMAAQ